MQRPHIPKLAFGVSRPAAADRVPQPAFAIHGVKPATHESTTSTSSSATGARTAASPSHRASGQLFQPRSAAAAAGASASSPKHHDHDEPASDDPDEADDFSELLNPATATRPTRSAFQRAEAMLERNDDDDDDDDDGLERDHDQQHDVDHVSSVTRRPLVDTPFTFEDGVTSERVLSTGSGSRRRSSRGPLAPNAAEQLAAATAAPQPAARARLDRGALRTWAATAAQLRQRGELMEREHSSWLQGRKAWFDPGSEELAIIAESERLSLDGTDRVRRERESLVAEVRRIKGLVKRFQSHVSSPQDAEAYVTQLRNLMESIEEALAALKSRAKEKYVALNLAERSLTDELDAMSNGFDRWNETDDVATTTSTPVKPRKNKPPSVADIIHAAGDGDGEDGTASSSAAEIRVALAKLEDAIEADGGATGGWDSRDHAHFLKLHTQHSGRADAAFLARLVAEVNNQTPATAMAHVEWYDQWRTRIDEKKDLIARWKSTKRVKDADAVQEELDQQQEAEKEERKQIAELLARDRAEKSAAVAEWKAAKQAREEARQAKLVAAKEEKERQQREKQEDERRRLRSIVDAYQEEKAVEQLVEQLQAQPTQRELQERERSERDARRRLRDKQEADLRAVREKREARLAETARREERRDALARAAAAPSTARDPSRLTQPTTAMLERARQREAEEAELVAYQKSHGGRTPSTMLARPVMGHTATPGWRKGM